MHCAKCNAEISAADTFCPECGVPVNVDVNVEGFENTVIIKKELRRIIDENGTEIIRDNDKFIALLGDYLPEYDKERRLLRTMLEANVLRRMSKDLSPKTSTMSAKNYMMGELFISENAAEFVLVCFAYVLDWDYTPTLIRKETDSADKSAKKEEKKKTVNINAMVFRPADAAKSRFKSNIVIPEGYTRIDSFCFDGFSFLRTVTLPSTLAAISEYAFSECKRLRGVELPESLKLIRQGAFSQCGKLTMVRIPKGIQEIEDNTFQFCRSLEVIDVPSTVSSIGNGAFSGCESLRKLFLPESIKFIDANAFAYCPQLTIRCYENSYVHKYCIMNGIKSDPVVKGTAFFN